MLEYVYLLHPLREGYFQEPTEHEKTAMESHFQYLQKAAEVGTVLLAGPCLDETFGIVIFQAENEEKARLFMFNDPSLVKNVMMAELHPLHVSLRGK